MSTKCGSPLERQDNVVIIEPIHPGGMLRGELEARGITLEEFARLSGVPLAEVELFVNERKDFTQEFATAIEKVIPEMPADFWMRWHETFCERRDNYALRRQQRMWAKKQNVLNPITLHNTVGAELAYIFDSHGIHDYESALGIKDLISKEKLTIEERKKAAEALKIPELYGFLTRFQNGYQEAKKKYQASESYKAAKQNYNSLKDVGKLLKGEFTDGFDVLSDIVDFFGVESEEEVFQNCKADGALFRRQNKVEVNAVNLHGWLRRGELDFRKLSLAEYDAAALQAWIDSRAWEAHIEDKEYFLSLPTVFATFGVGLVFVPFLPKTVYGAVRWFEGKPLVQISDRNKDLATCWFTLFHELGHVLRHRGAKIYEGEINEVNAQQNAQEREANKYANGYLFNGDDLRKAVFARHSARESMKAADLAEEFGVHPLFTAYWLRKAQHEPWLQRKINIDFSSPRAATEAADSIKPLSAPSTEP